MSPAVFRTYQQAAFADGNWNAGLTGIAQMATNNDPSKGAVGNFMGFPIYVAIGLDAVTTAPSTKANAHVVIAGIFDTTIQSNLKMTTDLIGDGDGVKVIDLENTTGDDKYRLMYEFLQGLDVAKPAEIVMYR